MAKKSRVDIKGVYTLRWGSMAWIESHQEMARHPKTRRVALRLGISKAAVIGHLHLLWWWTLDFAPDGDLSGFDAEEVAAVAEWEGDAEQFLQALLDTGWLDEGRRVHNWEDYAGRLVTAREGIRERQRRCREKKRDAVPPQNDDVTQMSRPCHGDVTPMSQLCHADVTVTSPLRHGTQNSTVQNQTEQNRTQPNRERVARGRAGGPAERSAGVPSLSRSRELVSDGEPAPVGGEHSGGVGNALPPNSGDLRERREPERENGALPSEAGALAGDVERVSEGREEVDQGVKVLPSGADSAPDVGEPSAEGGGSRPKVAALRVEGEDFSPAGGAAVGGASSGEALPGGEDFAGGAEGGNAPPMGEEAREALRQDAAFREAWRGWRLHLADLGRPLMSRGQERALLRECARRGPARAVEVISYSITKGAKNLIWDDAPRARRSQQPAAAKGRAPNPEGWPEWLAEEYPDRAGIDYADAPESVQGEFRRALQKTG
ncbi:hypothetical protein DB345_02405 [Spartobacteria bacterium LR76]|nr:hypothetical protein DB345_02405 [Spartobacteria bacterium LR76]